MYNNRIKNDIKIITYLTFFIIAFTIIICSLFLLSPFSGSSGYSLDEGAIKYIKGEGVVVEGSNTVKVYDVNKDKVIEMPLEEYILGVVAAEMPAEFNEEAIKAQSVAARTYYFSKRLAPCKTALEKGAEICGSTHCQAYMTKEERYEKWDSAKADSYWEKISSAVKGTEGQVMVYGEEIVKYPQFFAISGGKTEDSLQVFSGDIPYLKSVDSSWDEEATKYATTEEISNKTFVDTINSSYQNSGISTSNLKEKISIKERTEADYVKTLTIGSIDISGVDFRKLFNLRSTNFTIEFTDSAVKINCKGYGHGVGMSQWGANFMGKDGKKYNEILKHYYTGVEIEKVIYK